MPRPANNSESAARGSIRLAVALLISLLVHVTVLAIGAGVLDRHSDSSRPPIPKPQASTIRLGISESTVETLTWLGFQAPTPHEAIQSEVEQAAFALASFSVQAAVQSQSPGPTPMGLIEPSSSSRSLSSQARSPRAVADAESKAPAFEAELGPIDPPAMTESLAVATPEGKPTPSDAPQPGDAQGATGQTSAEQAAASEARREGTPSEKESPATSPTRPLRVQPGKPAATQGLEIQTRVPPELTIPTRLLAGDRRAVYMVSFSKDGTVKTARITRTSGNNELDQAGLNAMYNWTASGKPLENLDGDRVITVYIELIPSR